MIFSSLISYFAVWHYGYTVINFFSVFSIITTNLPFLSSFSLLLKWWLKHVVIIPHRKIISDFISIDQKKLTKLTNSKFTFSTTFTKKRAWKFNSVINRLTRVWRPQLEMKWRVFINSTRMHQSDKHIWICFLERGFHHGLENFNRRFTHRNPISQISRADYNHRNPISPCRPQPRIR